MAAVASCSVSASAWACGAVRQPQRRRQQQRGDGAQGSVRVAKLLPSRTRRRVTCMAAQDETPEDKEETIEQLEARLGMGRRARSDPVAYEERKQKQRKKKFSDMSAGEKVTETLFGERGAEYWANKLTQYALGGIVVAWICIRFVGPNLGLYDVVDPFANLPPPPSNQFNPNFKAKDL
eukprot:jgi/Chlat1/7272/Chrsp58S06907